MRTIISLHEPQMQRLATFCRRRAISRAEAVRQAVDLLIPPCAEDADGFGLWAKNNKVKDARQFVTKLREEWT
jgi:hypothetical protein